MGKGRKNLIRFGLAGAALAGLVLIIMDYIAAGTLTLVAAYLADEIIR